MVKDKINEFAMRGFRALGVSVADGDQTGPDECAPGTRSHPFWLASMYQASLWGTASDTGQDMHKKAESRRAQRGGGVSMQTISVPGG